MTQIGMNTADFRHHSPFLVGFITRLVRSLFRLLEENSPAAPTNLPSYCLVSPLVPHHLILVTTGLILGYNYRQTIRPDGVGIGTVGDPLWRKLYPSGSRMIADLCNDKRSVCYLLHYLEGEGLTRNPLISLPVFFNHLFLSGMIEHVFHVYIFLFFFCRKSLFTRMTDMPSFIRRILPVFLF